MRMSIGEWKRRYKQRFVDQANIPDKQAQECLDAAEFPDVLEGYEDDPEGSADMEMSYWND